MKCKDEFAFITSFYSAELKLCVIITCGYDHNHYASGIHQFKGDNSVFMKTDMLAFF